MSKIYGLTNVDTENNYNTNSLKKSSNNNTSFSSYLGETKSLDDIFGKAAEKYNVSESLLKAIGKAESDFNEKAVSRCGAQGIMQLMPATAASLGVKDSFDAEQNIMGGAKYISELVKKYDGDTSLALAAYNAGSGNVAKYGGIPPFKETQNYVKKVTNFMKQGVDTDATVTTKPKSTTVVTTNNSIISNIANNINTSNSLDSTESLLQNVDDVFSYDDYLMFLDKFLDDNKKKGSEDTPAYDALKAINYNVPVMNLLKS